MATTPARIAALTAAILAATAGGSTISAQTAQPATRLAQPAPAGWVFTPGFSVAESWDSNVLLSTEGSDTSQDFLTVFTPKGALSYRGRRSTLLFDYQGSYQLYQQLSELNAFDQRSNAAFRHRLTPAVTFFFRNSYSKSPTTDEIEVPGVEFRRQGVSMDDLSAGFEARLSQRTTLNAGYAFQWIDFDESGELLPVNGLTRGGHAHGASAKLGHVLTSQVTVGGEYDIRRGTVDQITEFDVQNALATVEWRLTRRLQLSGGAGVSWLSAAEDDGRQSAPAFRAELSGTGQRFGWTVAYRRSFLPSFGFGGTFQNQELTAGFLSTLSRRFDWSSSLAYRVNDPLVDTPLIAAPAPGDPLIERDLSLKSLWLRSSVSYLAARWMRIEGFYASVLQDSQRAGGKVNRSRLGVQVVTSTRMRVR